LTSCLIPNTDMDPNDGKMGRLPFGDITNISVLGAQNLHGNELKRQRERLCASGLSQEQRDEGNKRRREAYAKKKIKNKWGLQVMPLTSLNKAMLQTC